MDRDRLRFVSGRRSVDIGLFVFLALAIVATGWRLAVYHEVVYVEVEWVEIDSAGTRRVLETPERLRRLGGAVDPVDSIVGEAERTISALMASESLTTGGPDGQVHEWTISWAVNDDRPTDSRTVVFGPP